MAGDEPSRVLIVGTGPAGLLTAQALQKHGIQCTIFEQADALDSRTRDWNFGVYWAQSPLGKCLPEKLSNLVESTQVDTHKPSADDVLPIYNGQSGELLKNVPVPFELRMNRLKFRRLLSTGLDIRYGKRLSSLESDGKMARAYFEDGTSEVGNLLIGADGAHSKVREFLVGEDQAALEKVPILNSVTMAKLPMAAAIECRKLHPRHTTLFHPNGYCGWFSIHDAYDSTAPGDWTFMMIQSWLSKDPQSAATLLDSSNILDDMKKRAGEFEEPFKGIFQAIPDGTRCWHNQLSQWVTRPWDNRNGTVTLVGDAAHSMTYHRGQGTNNAIHDAASLAHQIKLHRLCCPSYSPSFREAITAYESEMQIRGKEAVLASYENSLATHDWSRLLSSPLFTAGVAAPN